MSKNHNAPALSTRAYAFDSEGGIQTTRAPELTNERASYAVAEWRRNAREQVRVEIGYYLGVHTVNVRVWYWDGDQLKPSKTGINLTVKHLPALAHAMAKAMEKAIELGLIQEGGASAD
jgi:hypothetical protein